MKNAIPVLFNQLAQLVENSVLSVFVARRNFQMGLSVCQCVLAVCVRHKKFFFCIDVISFIRITEGSDEYSL